MALGIMGSTRPSHHVEVITFRLGWYRICTQTRVTRLNITYRITNVPHLYNITTLNIIIVCNYLGNNNKKLWEELIAYFP
jgi:hypothetical protein